MKTWKKNAGLFLIIPVLMICVFLNGCGGGGGGKKGDNTTKPTYKAFGVGVIIENLSEVNSSRLSAKNVFSDSSWKQIDLSLGAIGIQVQQSKIMKTSGVPSGFLSGNAALVLLAWDQVSGAGHYQVYYNQTVVWDSDTVDTSKDPAFDKTKPQAYLDLDQELSKDPVKITEPGQYQFQIVALDGSTVIYQFSAVTVSLGMVLDAFPTIRFGSTNLTWSAVNSANEYRISFNEVTIDTVSNSILSYDVSKKLTASSGKNYYSVWVDARYLDPSGNPVEITRGRGGFSY